MFIVNEIQDIKVSGARHKLMVSIDEAAPGFYKEFTLSVEGGKRSVICDFQDDEGKNIMRFIGKGRCFTDALNHIKRQITYFDKFNKNYYAGGETYKCV